jgi:DNA-directed RNA polymerase subunit M/transcription elongation factor TFIIS
MMMTQCPHCGSTRVAVQETQSGNGDSLRRLQCSSCGYQSVTATSQRRGAAGVTYSHSHAENSQRGFSSASRSSSSSSSHSSAGIRGPRG